MAKKSKTKFNHLLKITKSNRLHNSILLFTILIALIACKKTDVASNGKRKIIDINFDEVSIPETLNKVVCRSGNGTSFMVAMGYADKLVGTADYVVSNLWADKFVEGITSLPSFAWAPSSEEMYSLGADLVMVSDPAVASNLREDGINAICYKQYNGEEIIASAKLMGTLFGPDAEKFADKWIEYYNETDRIIHSALKNVAPKNKPVAYFMYMAAHKNYARTAGGGSIENFWIEDSGGIFATPDLPNDGPKITLEEAVSRNPDVIFIGGVKSYNIERELLSNPIWSGVSAVANKRLYKIPIGFISWDFYGVEFPLLKLWAAKQMYPELISVDIHKITKDFYKEFYGKNFSDDEIDYILNALAPDGTEFTKK